MAARITTPLLEDRERIYTTGETGGPHEASTDSRLLSLADKLGMQPDALSQSSSAEREKGNDYERDRRLHRDPVVNISFEQLEELLTALDSTSDMLRQIGLNSVELESLTRQRRSHKIPRFITRHLLLGTVIWQILNIVAVVITEAFANNSKGDEKEEDKTVYYVSVGVIVVFQAANLLLVILTTIKLTKQIMHQTLTKSFLAQSFLSTTLLYAGLYTLVYKIEPSSFQHLTGAKDPLSTPRVFFKMVVFSISTGTLCGSSSIIPDMWPAQLIASTQMLMSYVYFASVLYMAVHPPKNDLKWRVITRSNHHRSLHHVRTV